MYDLNSYEVNSHVIDSNGLNPYVLKSHVPNPRNVDYHEFNSHDINSHEGNSCAPKSNGIDPVDAGSQNPKSHGPSSEDVVPNHVLRFNGVKSHTTNPYDDSLHNLNSHDPNSDRINTQDVSSHPGLKPNGIDSHDPVTQGHQSNGINHQGPHPMEPSSRDSSSYKPASCGIDSHDCTAKAPPSNGVNSQNPDLQEPSSWDISSYELISNGVMSHESDSQVLSSQEASSYKSIPNDANTHDHNLHNSITVPQTTKQWTIAGHGGWYENLEFHKNAPIPKMGERDVLVKIHAASMNYRDLVMVRGEYRYAQTMGAVPGSDGAGSVVAVGSRVTRFQPGDKVLMTFNQEHIYGNPDIPALSSGLGGALNGVFRQYGVFDEQGLVSMPGNLTYQEGCTLPCAAVSAWNSLYGLQDKALKAGDWVLVQGTGGVSIFALQFAKAAGAKVIATTSSAEKTEKLKKLGADYVINYKEDENWGETARTFTPNNIGVQHIVEVGGPKTITQAFKALSFGGNISVVGFLAGYENERQSFMDVLTYYCTVRGIIVGPRSCFEEMNKSIEANDIHPIIDEKVFRLEELKDAYQYMADQKFFGKIGINID